MRLRGWLVALLAAAAFGCGPKADLTKALEVFDVSSGWSDAGIVNGQNKVVPTISFKLRNTSDLRLVQVDLNAIFRRVTETEEWGSGLVRVAGSEGLGPGEATKTLTVESEKGYTSTDSRADILKNSKFVDAKVDLYAKYGNTQWVRHSEYPIARQLIAR
jgi:hypothetical protein